MKLKWKGREKNSNTVGQKIGKKKKSKEIWRVHGFDQKSFKRNRQFVFNTNVRSFVFEEIDKKQINFSTDFEPFSKIFVIFFLFAGIVPIQAIICRITGILNIISAPVPVIIWPGTNSSIKDAEKMEKIFLN